MIKIRGLEKSFGKKKVLKGVDLEIKRGFTTTIFGVSGGGKSTIIRHIIGLLKGDSGTILIDGVSIEDASEIELVNIRKKIGFLFQNGALFDSMNVYENVAFFLKEHTKLSENKILTKVKEKLELVGLNPLDVLELFPHELSGGMKKRVGLARTIITEPECILYDEPTSGLDPITSNLITQMIIKLQKELGVTSVLISHDIKESFKCSDYIAMLHDGKIIEYGSSSDIKNSSNPIIKEFIA
jgi:phospholipid/cholesterol/gamma-HCH transport system ATP-binding protein